MLKVWILALSFSLALGLSLPTHSYADQTFEGGTDRPGQDIDRIDIPPGGIAGPSICRGHCLRNERCNSWTFVASGFQGNTAVCWLKHGLPAPVRNNCCESGVVPRAFEDNIDRPGLDLGPRIIISGNPPECERLCREEPRCAAWTYVRKDVQGPSQLCYLKSAVPDAFPNDCCTSGVVRP